MAERPTQDLTSPAMRAALIRGLTSRRAVMTGALGIGATAALTACGSEGTGGTPTGSASASAKAAQDMSDTEKVVNWSNWTQYIDVSEDEKSRPTLDAFAIGVAATVTLMFVPVLLVFITMVASYLPAHRAVRLDPVQTLRSD